MDWLKKIHPAGVVGLATTLFGILSDPAVFALLPHQAAVGVTIVGAVIQAGTRAVHKGEIAEVKKDALASMPLTVRNTLAVKPVEP